MRMSKDEPLNYEPKSFQARADTSNGKKLFNVSFGDKSKRVEAIDSREAWALFCDSIQEWPSPKRGTVIEVKGR